MLVIEAAATVTMLAAAGILFLAARGFQSSAENLDEATKAWAEARQRFFRAVKGK